MIRKTIKYIAAALTGIASLASLSSCNDYFDLRPTDQMVLDEYWRSEGDVLAVTMECYRAMAGYNYIKRLIVWGELRSDNVIVDPGNGDGNLTYIGNLNLLPSNGYTSWGDFYNVINLCNTVEHFAPIACDNDPNFTRAQLNGYLAEVKGIRALTYFTLVRAFRDVPFVTEPTIDDTQEFQMAQEDPDKLLDWLIDDLKAAEPMANTSWSNTAYTKGRMTQNAIRAILADMCLWRGRYEEAVEYADRILDDTANPLTLESATAFSRTVFIAGNSKESIFELQLSSTTIDNGALRDSYGLGSGGYPMQISPYDFVGTNTPIFDNEDIRGRAFVYTNNNGATMAKYNMAISPNALTAANVSWSDYTTYNPSDRNWIIYRLPDIYFIKAEALAEQGIRLEEAFSLACRSYDRAHPSLGEGSLNYADYAGNVLDFIFQERQRENLFEGKRYFDLVRRISHHRADFSSIISSTLIPKYSDLDRTTVTTKLSTYDALFMPINATEMRSNLLLVQNPFYRTSSDINLN